MFRLTYQDSIISQEDYQELPPSVLPLLEYESEIAAEEKYLDYDWAHNEIVQHSMNWVRVGLVAHRMQYLKLWKGKFQSFADYCDRALGKDVWKIKDLIKAAEIVITLARAGFKILPSCQSQAMKLHQCCKKLEEDFAQGWIDAWLKVTETLAPKFITANSICEILGFAMTKTRITLPNDLRNRLAEEATERGLSIGDMLAQDYGIEEKTEEDNIESESESVPPEAIEAWSRDLEELVKEHDRQSWLTTVLIKLANLVPKRKSDFSFLLEHKLNYV